MCRLHFAVTSSDYSIPEAFLFTSRGVPLTFLPIRFDIWPHASFYAASSTRLPCMRTTGSGQRASHMGLCLRAHRSDQRDGRTARVISGRALPLSLRAGLPVRINCCFIISMIQHNNCVPAGRVILRFRPQEGHRNAVPLPRSKPRIYITRPAGTQLLC